MAYSLRKRLVLILIVLDDALRAQPQPLKSAKGLVLILIVLDDALRGRLTQNQFVKRLKVLILIVLDDALREEKTSSTDMKAALS